MFEIIKNAFTAVGEFISGLFSSVTSTILTVIFLICFTAILITLIVSYQKNHREEIHVVDTGNKLDDDLKKPNKENEQV